MTRKDKITSDRIFDALRAGHTTKPQIRKHLCISESTCHRVINSLVALGLVKVVTADRGAVPAVFALCEALR